MPPASERQRTPRRGRPAALAACAVLAVILNAAALGLAQRAAMRGAAVTTLASAAVPPTAMELVPAPDASTATVAPTPTATPTPRTATPIAAPSAAHRTAPRAPNAHTAPAAAAAAEPVLFYTFREVDSPAFPESDWNLDVDALDQLGVQRLVFEVLVSDRGAVVGCSVLEPADLADDDKRQLEQRLSETTLLPALRAGQLVASVRRIELLVASAPPEPPAAAPAYRP